MNQGEVVQYVVKAGTWFGSFPNEGTEYSFVGCTVSPGFEFEDFELGIHVYYYCINDLVVR